MILNNNNFLFKFQVLLCLFTVILLNACNQSPKAPVTKHTVTKKANNVTSYVDQKATPDTAGMDECPRGVAEPVVQKAVFPDAHFTLQSDNRSGIETLTLKSGDRLILKQSGCEYYILDLRFETSRFAADTADVAYWGNAALELMRQTAVGLDVPLEIDLALKKLSARLEKDKSVSEGKLTVGEEIDFAGPDPRQYLTIDRITQLADQRYAIEISLSYGPI
jgi:hypothetical protein